MYPYPGKLPEFAERYERREGQKTFPAAAPGGLSAHPLGFSPQKLMSKPVGNGPASTPSRPVARGYPRVTFHARVYILQ